MLPWLPFRETTICTTGDAYAHLLDLDKEPIPVDSTGNKIGLPNRGTASTVLTSHVLPSRMPEYYASGGCLRSPNRGAMDAMKGQYTNLIDKLVDVVLAESVRSRAVVCN